MKSFVTISISMLCIFCILFFIFIPKLPLDFEEIIIQMSAEYDLQPELVASVIYAESSFNENAISSAGAVGLMQLLPSTAEEIAYKLNIENYTTELLYSPEINIQFGCYYLSWLLDKFNGEITNSLAGYNAGPYTVLNWLNNEEYSENGVLINIPYSQTANYITKIEKAQKYYENKI